MAYKVVINLKSKSPIPIATFAEAWALMKSEIDKLIETGNMTLLSLEQTCWIEVDGKIIMFGKACDIAYKLGLISEAVGEEKTFKTVSADEARTLEPAAQALINREPTPEEALRQQLIIAINELGRLVAGLPIPNPVSPEDLARMRALRDEVQKLHAKVAQLS